jgi:hypothetical protein
MAARDFGFDTLLLVSSKLNASDVLGIWSHELDEISSAAGARIELFDNDWEAHRHLTGRGLIFSASESDLQNHATTHDVFRYTPASYLRVTLQHGFECVGFRHSADHVRAHGRTASFAADILCAWAPRDRLTSLAPSQNRKVVVTGPTSVLQLPLGEVENQTCPPGLVCENLHSVRFGGAANAQSDFIDDFTEFARRMGEQGKRVTLRPHPGGQYFLKSKLTLPPNVQVENSPAYRLDLRKFAYGISGPSSVLIEMLLACIPAAVWRDRNGEMDLSSYEGLAIVSSSREWLDFVKAAEADPKPFLAQQECFLGSTGMPLKPTEVFRNYAQLFQAARRMEVRSPGSVAERERILFVANEPSAGPHLGFHNALAPLVARGELAMSWLTERDIDARHEIEKSQAIRRRLDSYNPSAIVLHGYRGAASAAIVDWAAREQVPVIYWVTDDCMADSLRSPAQRPTDSDEHQPLRVMKDLLPCADLIYVSTETLKAQLLGYFPCLPIVAGKASRSTPIIRRAARVPARKVGYLASSDGLHDLEPIIPVLVRLLHENTDLQLQLFGRVGVPEALKCFGDRIFVIAPVANGDELLDELSRSECDIGICPFAPSAFKATKTNIKWVEYTAIGAAVVASRGTAYDECCVEECGILAETPDEWFSALDLLINDADQRFAIAERAQAKLEQECTVSELREQILTVVAEAHRLIDDRSKGNRNKKEVCVCHLQ